MIQKIWDKVAEDLLRDFKDIMFFVDEFYLVVIIGAFIGLFITIIQTHLKPKIVKWLNDHGADIKNKEDKL